MDPEHGERFIDVAVLAAGTHLGVAAQARLERHERKKHTRYPGPRLIPSSWMLAASGEKRQKRGRTP